MDRWIGAVMTGIDVGEQLLMNRLQAQAAGLRAELPEAAALAAAAGRPPEHTGWRGPARRAYDEATRRLEHSCRLVESAVHAALAHTQTALTTLGDRVH